MPVNSSKKNYAATSVHTSPDLTDGILSLLKKNVLGTKGKIRYKQKQIKSRLIQQPDIYFLQVHIKKSLYGVIGLEKRAVKSLNINHDSVYVRYLTFRNSFHSNRKKHSKKAVNSAKNSSLFNTLNNELTQFLSIDSTGLAKLTYAYVEAENSNSYELCRRFGFSEIRVIYTNFISRFRPKLNANVIKVDFADATSFQNELQSFYANHTLFYLPNDLEDDTRWTIKINGEIVAGIRSRPINWEIVELPGFLGKVARQSLFTIPYLNKIIQKDSFKFLAVDQIWYKDGHQQLIQSIIEHALYNMNCNLAMAWTDEKSPVFNLLQSKIDIGLFSVFQKPVKAYLMVKGLQDHPEIAFDIERNPVFISSSDMT